MRSASASRRTEASSSETPSESTGIVSVLESGELDPGRCRRVGLMSAGGPPKPYTIRMSALGGAPQCAQQGVLTASRRTTSVVRVAAVCGRVNAR